MSSARSIYEDHSRLLLAGIEATALPFLVLDDERRFAYLNRAAERLTGYSSEEAQGLPPEQLLLPRRGDGGGPVRDEHPVYQALECDERTQVEVRIRRKDGTLCSAVGVITPLAVDGTAAGAVVELRDGEFESAGATNVDGKTGNSEEYYNALINSIDQGYFVCEIILDDGGQCVDYRFLEMNPSFEESTGLAQAAGRTARELVPDLEPHWFERYGRVALTGKSSRFIEGSVVMGRWFEVHAFRIGGDDSLKVGALFTNITERKRAEEERERLMKALELERTRLATVFHHAPAAIATLRGREHVFEMANPMYHELVGGRAVIGKTAREAFPELENEGIFELLDDVYTTGKPFVGRGVRVPLRNESTGQEQDHFLDFVYQPLREPDGTISGIFAHAADVTEHKKAVEALAKAHVVMEQRVAERTAELKALNAELESFNYSVSHDLRAPLRGINGFSRVLQEDYEDVLDEAGQRYLERIQAAAGRMGQLIDDLLNLSQLNRARVSRQRVDLTDLARRVAGELVEREPAERQIEITVEDGLTAVGDPSLLRIVLDNLIGNAVKFSTRQPEARVHVGALSDEKGNENIFFVRDNGAGFSMDQVDRLFVPFQRLHAAHEYSGTGVGLVTVQRIIRKHSGRIWADAEVDEGATFYFALPVVPPGSGGSEAD